MKQTVKNRVNIGKTKTMKKQINIYKYAVWAVALFLAGITFVEAQVDFKRRNQFELNGDMTIIGNNILSRHGQEFNQSGYNDHRQAFINIDPTGSGGIPNFSSSSAELRAENYGASETGCSTIKYAALYWAGMTDQYDSRRSNFNKVRIKLPGTTNYVDITADNVIRDNINETYGQYVCLKDVTNLIKNNPSGVLGNYTVANVVAREGVAYAAGWSLIIVYENPKLTLKNISLFDGFSQIRHYSPYNRVNINVDGFITPTNTDFVTKIAVSTLEGEEDLRGDQFKIKAGSRSTWTTLGNSSLPNKTDNFFDSSITIDDVIYPHRNPASTNTLGYDLDYFTLNNPNFSVIPKGETSATLQATSNQDHYFIFFVAFNVETVAPDIKLVKRVKDANSGAELANTGVEFAQKLKYEIEFQNIGNDDAVGAELIDKLPPNVDYKNNISVPNGVTFIGYDKPTHTVRYSIADRLLTKEHPQKYTIEIEVSVVPDCSKLRDACSNEVSNQAKMTYRGKLNGRDAERKSFNSINDCGYGVEDPTNFLIVDDSCNDYIYKVSLCGRDIDLVAGDGFQSYQWVNKNDPGNIIATTRTLTVTPDMLINGEGNFMVTKAPTPQLARCKNALKENYNVKIPSEDADKRNPLRGYATNIETCLNDGKEYIQFYLCGTNDVRDLTISENGKEIKWHKMITEPNIPRPDSCPYFLNEGDWQENIKVENNTSTFRVTEEGRYAVEIWDPKAKCGQTYYFRVFKSNFEYTAQVRNIICNSPGKITVNDVPANYQYRIEKDGSTATTKNWQTTNVFTVSEKGWYNIYVRQILSGANATTLQDNVCEYVKRVYVDKINVEEEVILQPTPVKCKDGKGSLRIVVSDKIYPNINVKITPKGGSNSVANYTINTVTGGERDKTISGLNNATYEVNFTTDDGCNFTKEVVVDKIPDLTITSAAGEVACEDEVRVNMQVTGGTLFPNQSYGYKVRNFDTDWRYVPSSNGVASFTFSDPSFTNGTKKYTIDVIDKNNCQTSKEITVTFQERPTFTLGKLDAYCNGEDSGKVIFNVTNPANVQVKYYIRKKFDDGTYPDTWEEQTNPIFIGKSKGTFEGKIGYRIGTSNCETATQTVEISEGKGPVTAFAGVIQVACDASGKAKVKITNVQGGDPQGTPAQYYYSFDNKATWGTSSTGLLAPGQHTVYVSDRNTTGAGCEYPMQVNVPNAPSEPLFTQTAVSYDCEGKGTVTINNNKPTYTYEYVYGGTTTSSNIISGLTPGTHTITVNYKTAQNYTLSILFRDDFGVGAGHFKSEFVNQDYYFNSQKGGTIYNGRGGQKSSGKNISDGEYAITNEVNPVYGTWLSPLDHTNSDPNGRFLAMNLGNTAGRGGIIYERKLLDYDPNREIKVEFYAYNLLKSTSGGHSPEIQLELVDASGNPIAQATPVRTIPKNTHPSDWHKIEETLNPAGNASLSIRIRSYSVQINGNDLALDDILLYQEPEVCPQSKEISVTVGDGKAFKTTSSTEEISHQKCSGTADGSFKIGLENVGAGYEYRYRSATGWSNWQASTANPLVLDNLASGTYTLELRKENNPNCNISKTFTINPAQPINLTLDNNNQDLVIACNQTATKIEVTATGGSGSGYSYVLTEPDGNVRTQTSKLFTNLTQEGTYKVGVRDAHNCGGSIEKTFKVKKATAPTISVTSGNSSYCLAQGGSTNIEVSATGGDSASYVFTIEPNMPNTSNRFTIDRAGTYTITVTDKYSCSDTTTITIAESLGVSSVKTKDITCDVTDKKAKIEVSVTGGYSPYTYQVSKNGAGFTAISGAQNVTATKTVYTTEDAGNYKFKITDAKGCTIETAADIKIELAQKPEVTLSATNVKCNGGTTNLEVTIAKGVPNYTIKLESAGHSDTQIATTSGTVTFNNVPAGNYTVKVVDAYKCESEEKTINITQPDLLKGKAEVSELASCHNGTEGVVKVFDVQGGTPPYQYDFGRGFGSTSTSTMSVGTHNVIIKDRNSCTVSIPVKVLAPPAPPTAPVVSDTDITYNCDGTANFTVVPNGTTSFTYTYSLDGVPNSPDETSPIFKNVATGTHTITLHYKQKNVTAKDCGDDINIFVTIKEGQEFKATDWVSVDPIKCKGGSDGSAVVTVKGFLPQGYKYALDGGVGVVTTTENLKITGLNVGEHTLVLTYVNADGTDGSCSVTRKVTLTEPTALVATATIETEAKCSNNKKATVKVTADGGTRPYQYMISGGTWQTSNMFTNLAVGTYTIKVKDRNNCEIELTDAVEVKEPKEVTFTASPTLCFDGTNGEIKVDVTNGNGNYRVRIGLSAFVNITGTSHTITNLSEGIYDVVVEDAYGCSSKTTVTIKDQLKVANVNVTDVNCKEGAVDIRAIGGDRNYVYAVVSAGGTPSVSDFVANSTISITTTGNYDVWVRDNNGNTGYCDAKRTGITISQAPELTYTITTTNPKCSENNADGGSINVRITQGRGSYDISLADGVGTTIASEIAYGGNSKRFEGLSDGDYVVSVKDFYGCVVTKTVTIIPAPDLGTATIKNNLPSNCSGVVDFSEYGFTISSTLATSLTLEYSKDNGGSWQSSPEFLNIPPGTIVHPVIRSVDANGVVLCSKTLPDYKTRGLLEPGSITVSSTVASCSDGIDVTVTANEGQAPYKFSISTNMGVWEAPTGTNTNTYTFKGLIPGRSYQFYVQDTNGCITESEDLYSVYTPTTTIKVEKTTPVCNGAGAVGKAEISVRGTDATYTKINWELYKVETVSGTTVGAAILTGSEAYTSRSATISLANLNEGVYYVKVIETDAAGTKTCTWASRNFTIEELTPITIGSVTTTTIGCEVAGVVELKGVTGSAGYGYSYEITGANISGTITSTNPSISIERDKLKVDNVDEMDITIKITDYYGCDTTTSTKIKVSTKPELKVEKENCADDFAITVTPYIVVSNMGAVQTNTASASDYTYSIGGNYEDNGGKFTGITPGTYTVTVKDKITGCISREEIVTIYPKLEIESRISKLIDCTTSTSAEIEVKFINGSGDYQIDYVAPGGGGGTVATIVTPTTTLKVGETAGTYRITVTDKKNTCTPIVKEFTLDEKITPEFTVTATAISCYSGTTNIVVTEVDKGTGPYTYELRRKVDNSLVNIPFDMATKAFADVLEGEYIIISTSGQNSCTTSVTIELDAPTQIVIPDNAIRIDEFACTSNNTVDEAVVTIDPSKIGGGTLPIERFKFVYTPITGSVEVQESGNYLFKTTNTSGGVVSITVFDKNGCVNPTVKGVNIKPFDELKSLSVSVQQGITCESGENVKIVATTTKGFLDKLRYSKDNGVTWQDSEVFNNLPIGNYTFYAEHKETGCILSVQHEVKDPNTFRIKAPIITEPKCKGNDASVMLEIEPNGYPSSGGFKWKIEGVSASGTTTNLGGTQTSGYALGGAQTLPAGVYTATIELLADPKCEQVTTFSIIDPEELSAETKVTSQTCALDDAIIEITNAQGGRGEYEYFVGKTTLGTKTFVRGKTKWTGLDTGTYEVWMKDKGGCEKQLLPNIKIDAPAPISATLTITTQNCNGNNGVIRVDNITGGAGKGYKLRLIKDGIPVGVPILNKTTFTNLSSGNYTVEITDGWSCSVTLTTGVTLYEPISARPTAEILKEITCANPTGAKVKVLHSGGSNNIKYTIKSTDNSYNQTNNTGEFYGLNFVGSYSIEVKDLVTGCSPRFGSFILTRAETVSFTYQTTSPTCNGASDGTIIARLVSANQPPYEYKLEKGGMPTIVQNNGTFSGLSEGTYKLTVTSSRSCTAVETIVLGEPAQLQSTSSVNGFSCNAYNLPQRAELVVTPAGGTAPYYYSLDGRSYVRGTASHTFYFNDTGVDQNITYYVKDANGCTTNGTDVIKTLPVITNVVASLGGASATCANPESINVEVSGGGSSGFVITEIYTGITKTITGSNATFAIQEPGNYVFRAKSLETGCSVDSAPYTIADYRTISVDAVAKSTVQCLGDPNGKIEIDVTGYTGGYDYEVLDSNGNSLTPPNQGTSNTSAKHVINNVPAGVYKVRVIATNTPFCTATSTLVTIDAPSRALTVSTTQISDLTCDGGDATIRAEAEGGWGEYKYRLYKDNVLYPPYDAYTTTSVFTNLPAGSYVVEVMDKNGCEKRSDNGVPSLTIAQPQPIIANITVNPLKLDCIDSSNGTIEVTNVKGGSQNYSYILINQDTNATITTIVGTVSAGIGSAKFENLSKGTYRVEIADGWNCGTTLVGNVVTIDAPTEVTATATISRMPTCSTDGEIIVTASGGNGGYRFDTDPTGAFTNVSGKFPIDKDQTKTYKFYVRDAKGCPVETNEITVDKVEPIVPTIDLSDSEINIDCKDDNTGKIVVTSKGGVGGYKYVLTGALVSSTNPDNPTLPMNNTTGVFEGLTAGNYTIEVTGTGDCDVAPYKATITQRIDEAPALVVQNATHTNVTCRGGEDGTITVDVTGGTGAIQYAISPLLSRFESSGTFKDLKADTYKVIAKDANGCTIEFDFVVEEPELLVIEVLSHTNELCYGAEDGTARVKITGGTAPYEVSVDGYNFYPFTPDPIASTATITYGLIENIPAREGAIYVRDVNACSVENSLLFEVLPGVDLQATATLNYTCANNSIEHEIEAKVVATELANIDKYVLDEGTPNEVTQTNPKFTGNFSVGYHTVTIYHNGGCIQTVGVTVESVGAIEANISVLDVTCAGQSNGRIDVTPLTADRGGFDYSITPDPHNLGVTSQSFFEGLPGGNYTVRIEDPKYGCVTETVVEVYEPKPLVVSITHQQDESCFGTSDGELTFHITGGRPDYIYDLKDSRGVTYRDGENIKEGEVISFTGMKPGSYTLYYKDSGYNGVICEETLADPILIRRAPDLASANVEVDYTCPTASNTLVTANLIVTFAKDDFKDWNIYDLRYALNSTNIADAKPFSMFMNGDTEGVINNIPAGKGQFITLFFRDCSERILQTFDVERYQPLVLRNISKDNVPNLVEVEAQGGKAPYRYYFNGEDYGAKNTYYLQRFDEDEVLPNKKVTKKVNVTVYDDLGCPVDIEVFKDFIDIEVPDYFTPNGDGKNDTWKLNFATNYPNMETMIYDRNGRLIKVLKQGDSWDGNYNGRPLPAGDYWYLIYLNETEEDSRTFVGHFTLYR